VKILPCASQDCERQGRLALAGALPYYALHWPGSPGEAEFAYECSRCERLNRISAIEFNRLPELAPADLRYLPDLAGHLARDLSLGGALTAEQAVDLLAAGFFTPHDLPGPPVPEPSGPPN
jgi:hypothetical protein